MNTTIDVRVPANPEHIHVLRTVVSSVASRLDASIDDIADLQLAVDEAATQLLGTPGSSALSLTITVDDDRLELVAASDGALDRWPPPDVDRSLGRKVLEALVDEVAFEVGASGPVLRLRRDARRA